MFIVLASDGVWDVMSSADVVGFVVEQENCKTIRCDDMKLAPQKLVDEARSGWEYNNTQKRNMVLKSVGIDEQKRAEKIRQLDKLLVIDDISTVVAYLHNRYSD